MNPLDTHHSDNGQEESSSNTGGQIFCDECQWNDASKKVEGIAFCADCNAFLCIHCLYSHHNSFASKDHRILEGKDMPSRKCIITKPSVSTMPEHECVNVCKKHTGSLLEYYCKDHRLLTCAHCMNLDHVACKNKDLIASISCQEEAELQVSTFLNAISKLQKKLKDDQKRFAENIDGANSAFERTSTNLSDFHKRLDNTVASQASQVRNEMVKLRDKRVEALRSSEQVQQAMMQEVEQLCKEVDSLRKLNKKSVLFSLSVLKKEQLESWNLQRKDFNKRNKADNYSFQGNEKTLKSFENVSTFGTLLKIEATCGDDDATKTSDSTIEIKPEKIKIEVGGETMTNHPQQPGFGSIINPKRVILEGGGHFEEGQRYVIRDRLGNSRLMIMRGGSFHPDQRPAGQKRRRTSECPIELDVHLITIGNINTVPIQPVQLTQTGFSFHVLKGVRSTHHFNITPQDIKQCRVMFSEAYKHFIFLVLSDKCAERLHRNIGIQIHHPSNTFSHGASLTRDRVTTHIVLVMKKLDNEAKREFERYMDTVKTAAVTMEHENFYMSITADEADVVWKEIAADYE